MRRLHGWLVTQQRAENRELRAYARGLEEGFSALHGMKFNITLEGGRPDEHSESTI